ncbi:MAG TPA: PAS domain-containing protein [Candidatus Acidoferrales bacterium]|nr:PAS domain-containing protein [Candidatus Acidoferrales bacterium]
MQQLHYDDYLEILQTVAGLAHYGVAVFRWEPSERFPRYEWVNDAILKRTKTSREGLLAHSAAFLKIGNNAQFVDTARKLAERADESPFEAELTRVDGTTYWVECAVRPLKPALSGALRFICATYVIDRRKEQERFSKLLAATIDSEPDGTFIVRLRGENLLEPPVLYVNPAFSRMTGWSAQDLASGIYPRLFGAATDRTLVSEHARSVLSGEAVVTEIELYRKDGTRFWAEVRAHPLESPTIYCAISIHDVTERRRAQEAMNMLSEGVAQASDFMIVTDDTAPSAGGPAILHVNRSFLEATGFDERVLIGRPYDAIYSPNNPPSLMESIRASIEAGQPNYREVLALRDDGSEFWIEFVDRPFTTRHGRRLRLMVGRDITLRRRSSAQLSLLFAATEQATTPIVIYEPGDDGRLTVSYENEAATLRDHYHLLALWNGADADARVMRDRLERGEPVVTTYTRTREGDRAELVRMVARPIRNASRLEAVLTQEHLLLRTNGESARSRLIDLAVMLPALERAKDANERLAALRSLLETTFEATLEVEPIPADGPVHIDEVSCVARFAFDGRAARATWTHPLEPLAITALRFAIEAATNG